MLHQRVENYLVAMRAQAVAKKEFDEIVEFVTRAGQVLVEHQKICAPNAPVLHPTNMIRGVVRDPHQWPTGDRINAAWTALVTTTSRLGHLWEEIPEEFRAGLMPPNGAAR